MFFLFFYLQINVFNIYFVGFFGTLKRKFGTLGRKKPGKGSYWDVYDNNFQLLLNYSF